MPIVVKLLGTGVGLVSESFKYQKAKRAGSPAVPAEGGNDLHDISRLTQPHDLPPQYVEVSNEQGQQLISHGHAVPVDAGRTSTQLSGDSTSSGEEGDEEAWQLDEAFEHLEETESSGTSKDTTSLTTDFLKRHPSLLVPYNTPRSYLPCPVILPQRRPRDKKRGFVRAYAPVLEDVGIDQATFLEFLKIFKKSIEADGWLQAVNIGAAAVGFYPSVIVMGVSTAIQVAVGVAMEVQRRSRSWTFLDRLNEEFFKPRGLYCLVMTYKPDLTKSHTRVDINQTIANDQTPATSATRQVMRNLHKSSGKTYGELELPESASLIFPAIEKVVDNIAEGGTKKEGKMKSAGKFVEDYIDRRAQATWTNENPDSKLAATGAKPEFTSRYADPTHAVNNGGIVSFLTGGKINPKAKMEEKRLGRKQRGAEKRGEQIPTSVGGRRGKKGGPIKRVLMKDVLYLMIVNLPTEAEIQAGRQAVERDSEQ
ncbi:hypothetical protein VTL71DRAFT_9979 [Oculimacula yallundae]|uniref:Uncharacterized protein n=1 Tax=Oculimacula yallundae TaxID=86028 RepID=A0ABR4BRX8_9HELO